MMTFSFMSNLLVSIVPQTSDVNLAVDVPVSVRHRYSWSALSCLVLTNFNLVSEKSSEWNPRIVINVWWLETGLDWNEADVRLPCHIKTYLLKLISFPFTFHFFTIFRSGIDESLTLTKNNLDKLYAEISKTLEKISSREKYLNSQFETQLTEYRWQF